LEISKTLIVKKCEIAGRVLTLWYWADSDTMHGPILLSFTFGPLNVSQSGQATLVFKNLA